jgi:hypothetical protein
MLLLLRYFIMMLPEADQKYGGAKIQNRSPRFNQMDAQVLGGFEYIKPNNISGALTQLKIGSLGFSVKSAAFGGVSP